MTSPAAAVPTAVRAAFGLDGEQMRLPGGQGSSVRISDAVLKPVDDPVETAWASALLTRLPEDGFRLARPLRGRDGSWVVQGWSAARLVAGVPDPAGHWHELLEAGRALHAALRDEPCPAFLGARSHRWAVADRVAWGETEPDLRPEFAPLHARLQQALDDEPALPRQLVHGDLSGNVLFAPGLAPAIIDFSPYWRPPAYAEAVAAVDTVLWGGGGDEVLLSVASASGSDLLVRALVFRVVALSERSRSHDGVLAELPALDEAIRKVLALR